MFNVSGLSERLWTPLEGSQVLVVHERLRLYPAMIKVNNLIL